MLKHPLYFPVAKSRSAWSTSVSTVFDIERMLSGNPAYWQKLDETYLLKKKTLILNLPFSGKIEFKIEFSDMLIRRLAELHQDNFKIYYQNLHFEFCALESFRVFADDHNDLISSDELIQQAMQELNLSYDELFILDDKNLHDFLAEKTDWRQLPSFSDANLAVSNITGESLGNFLDEQGSQIERLNLSNCTNLEEAQFKPTPLPKLKSLILGNEVTSNAEDPWKDYSNISIPSDYIHAFVTTTCQSLEVLNLNNLPQLQLRTVEHLLTQSRLKELHLSSCKLLDNDKLFAHFDTSALEVLILSNTNISTAVIGQLLSKATQLRKLSLIKCSLDNLSQHLTSPITQHQLKYLDLSSSNIDTQSLSKLILSHPQLSELNVCTECSVYLTIAQNTGPL